MANDPKLTLRISADTADATANLQRLGSATESIGHSASVAEAGVQGFSDSFGSLGQSMVYLNNALGVLESATAALSGLAAQADQWASIQARVKLATEATDDYRAVTEELFQVAQRTGTDLESVATLYQRTAQALKSMGQSASSAAADTELVSKAMRVSMGTTAESSAAMIQFAQALSSGVLRGEEFNSVMEQAPRLSSALATALGVTTGQLRKMAEAGQLTGTTVLTALRSQREAIEADFVKLPGTISTAVTRLNNEWGKLVGTLSSSSGITAGVASSIEALAAHLDDLAQVAGGGAVAGLAVGLVRLYEAGKSAVASAREHTAAEKIRLEAMAQATAAAAADAAAQEAQAQAARTASMAAHEQALARTEAAARTVAAVQTEIAAYTEEELAQARSAKTTLARATTAEQAAAAKAAAAATEVAAAQKMVAAADRELEAERKVLAKIHEQETSSEVLAVVIERVQRAELAQAQATDTLTAATQRLTTAQQAQRQAGAQIAVRNEAAALKEQAAAAGALTGAQTTLGNSSKTLTGAQTALAGATSAAGAAQRAAAEPMGVFAKAGQSVLSFLGGWPGVLLAAGAALVYFSSSTHQALEPAEQFADRLKAIRDGLQKFDAETLARKIGTVKDELNKAKEAAKVSLWSVLSGNTQDHSLATQRVIELTDLYGDLQRRYTDVSAVMRRQALGDIPQYTAIQQSVNAVTESLDREEKAQVAAAKAAQAATEAAIAQARALGNEKEALVLTAEAAHSKATADAQAAERTKWRAKEEERSLAALRGSYEALGTYDEAALKNIATQETLVESLRSKAAEEAAAADQSRLAAEQARLATATYGDQSSQLGALKEEHTQLQDAIRDLNAEIARGDDAGKALNAAMEQAEKTAAAYSEAALSGADNVEALGLAHRAALAEVDRLKTAMTNGKGATEELSDANQALVANRQRLIDASKDYQQKLAAENQRIDQQVAASRSLVDIKNLELQRRQAIAKAQGDGVAATSLQLQMDRNALELAKLEAEALHQQAENQRKSAEESRYQAEMSNTYEGALKTQIEAQLASAAATEQQALKMDATNRLTLTQIRLAAQQADAQAAVNAVVAEYAKANEEAAAAAQKAGEAAIQAGKNQWEAADAAKKAAEESIKATEAKAKAERESIQYTDQIAAALNGLADQYAWLGDSSVLAWMRSKEALGQFWQAFGSGQIVNEFASLRERLEGIGKAATNIDLLTESLQSGEFTAKDLANAINAAKASSEALGAERLLALRAAIASAKQEMEDLRQEADDTLKSWQDKLDQLRGNDLDIATRQRLSDLADLQAQLDAAVAAGNAEAAANIRAAIDAAKAYWDEYIKGLQAADDAASTANIPGVTDNGDGTISGTLPTTNTGTGGSTGGAVSGAMATASSATSSASIQQSVNAVTESLDREEKAQVAAAKAAQAATEAAHSKATAEAQAAEQFADRAKEEERSLAALRGSYEALGTYDEAALKNIATQEAAAADQSRLAAEQARLATATYGDQSSQLGALSSTRQVSRVVEVRLSAGGETAALYTDEELTDKVLRVLEAAQKAA